VQDGIHGTQYPALAAVQSQSLTVQDSLKIAQELLSRLTGLHSSIDVVHPANEVALCVSLELTIDLEEIGMREKPRRIEVDLRQPDARTGNVVRPPREALKEIEQEVKKILFEMPKLGDGIAKAGQGNRVKVVGNVSYDDEGMRVRKLPDSILKLWPEYPPRVGEGAVDLLNRARYVTSRIEGILRWLSLLENRFNYLDDALEEKRISRFRDRQPARNPVSLLEMHELGGSGPIVPIEHLLSKATCEGLNVPMDVQEIVQIRQDLLPETGPHRAFPDGDHSWYLKSQV
jgi:hypothetical protein